MTSAVAEIRPLGSGGPDPARWPCPVCGTSVLHEYRAGRKRVYCCNGCKQKAYRWRRQNGVRLCVTPWLPAQRSSARRMHAVRPSKDFVGGRRDGQGREVAVCGAFGYVANPQSWLHTEFVPGSHRACGSCTRLIGADPTWIDEYPILEHVPPYRYRYRPPEERLADYRRRRRSPGTL